MGADLIHTWLERRHEMWPPLIDDEAARKLVYLVKFTRFRSSAISADVVSRGVT